MCVLRAAFLAILLLLRIRPDAHDGALFGLRWLAHWLALAGPDLLTLDRRHDDDDGSDDRRSRLRHPFPYRHIRLPWLGVLREFATGPRNVTCLPAWLGKSYLGMPSVGPSAGSACRGSAFSVFSFLFFSFFFFLLSFPIVLLFPGLSCASFFFFFFFFFFFSLDSRQISLVPHTSEVTAKRVAVSLCSNLVFDA